MHRESLHPETNESSNNIDSNLVTLDTGAQYLVLVQLRYIFDIVLDQDIGKRVVRSINFHVLSDRAIHGFWVLLGSKFVRKSYG